MAKSNNLKQKLLIAIIMIAGLLILFYPVYSNLINQHQAKKHVDNYKTEVKKIKESDIDKIYKKAVVYNKNLINESVPESFAKRVGIKHDKRYESMLDVTHDGLMGCVRIPSIDVNLPIYHYTTKGILEKGAGHLFGSSLPIGGKNTHAVITAHRGLPSAKMFTDLDQLRKDDEFFIDVLDKTLAYKVDKIKTVKPDETKDLGIVKDKDYMTLVTCTPYAKNTHRLLVRGHRVPYHPGDEDKQVSRYQIPWKHILCILIGILIAVAVYMIATRWNGRFPSKKNRK